jgi:AraC family transcriptional regulator, regulatory protein of adaptative response / DNA-3-methyladenine glycosylase II
MSASHLARRRPRGSASAVVSRALRLIHEGALDAGKVEQLAGRVGLGSRHLRRLFVQHLGTSPIKIASTRRVHFARNLLDQNQLPITKIASYSGFKSIRQFNHAVRATFDFSPSELRKLRSGVKPSANYGGITLHLPYRPPFDWQAIIRFLKPRETPGVELIEDDCWQGSIVGATWQLLQVFRLSRLSVLYIPFSERPQKRQNGRCRIRRPQSDSNVLVKS